MAWRPRSSALEDDALKEIIRRYTREAGVRSLEREIAKLARKSVKELLTTQEEERSRSR